VTPTRNRRDVLVRAIESVRAQSFREYEHIVIDDGSTDGSEEAVSGLGYPQLRFVRLDSWRGANAARNHGIALARSDLITFLDSDDEFLPFRLERCVEMFARQPLMDLAISSFLACKDGARMPTVNRGVRFDASTLERAIAAQVTAIAGSAITVRRAAIQSVGLFDEGLWRLQDRDLLLRLAASGCGAAIIEEIDWIKHYSEDSISRQRNGYVAAYGELLMRHPRIRKQFPDIAAYMVARRLLSNLLQCRVRELVSEYRANKSSETLRFSPAVLAAGYFSGRKQRRQIVREVKNLPAHGLVGEQRRSPVLSRS